MHFQLKGGYSNAGLIEWVFICLYWWIPSYPYSKTFWGDEYVRHCSEYLNETGWQPTYQLWRWKIFESRVQLETSMQLRKFDNYNVKKNAPSIWVYNLRQTIDHLVQDWDWAYVLDFCTKLFILARFWS